MVGGVRGGERAYRRDDDRDGGQHRAEQPRALSHEDHQITQVARRNKPLQENTHHVVEAGR
ncbi:MAG: hypothetical protein JOZ49_23230 [Mycolicibacterium sp.]|nr:hypothetical protein [Mycolicibacterium sp.]